ncbi:Heavy metal transport/detoxification protein [Hymenobacter roseosalivarius DSM 11622]|uniref:Mercuric transport protein MerT n=1 Tax=Hymenobacter roseosalivarius DSM 11622 TaxID=645990 RepID=A0A1W1W2K9_9BACT|nr:mercuric transport protein MerTP [Hymenobacter roseosalivarius]SMB99631.1 Heavy metal transport/detoxification protein [Hymenobacter roseosalivarius DSM 11622]
MNSTPSSGSKSWFGAGLLAALAASLCCITPLLALVGGLGGAASAFSWLAPFRPYLVALTVAVLGFAWYRQLRPSPTADCCAVPKKKPLLQTTGFLGAVTGLAALLLALPYYDTLLYPSTPPFAQPGISSASARPTAPVWQTRMYRIGGMTCEACEQHVVREVQQVPGIAQVEVSYAQGTAQVSYDASRASSQQVEQAIAKTGYQVLNAH